MYIAIYIYKLWIIELILIIIAKLNINIYKRFRIIDLSQTLDYLYIKFNISENKFVLNRKYILNHYLTYIW